jgi:hypothetical protein
MRILIGQKKDESLLLFYEKMYFENLYVFLIAFFLLVYGAVWNE